MRWPHGLRPILQYLGRGVRQLDGVQATGIRYPTPANGLPPQAAGPSIPLLIALMSSFHHHFADDSEAFVQAIRAASALALDRTTTLCPTGRCPVRGQAWQWGWAAQRGDTSAVNLHAASARKFDT